MSVVVEELWRKTVARGVLIVLVAGVSSVVVTNTAGFLLPILIAGYGDGDPEATKAAMHLGLAWVRGIPGLFAVLLVIGVWKSTPASPLEHAREASRFRRALRGLVVAYAVLCAVTTVTAVIAIGGFRPVWAGELVLIWVRSALWWGLVLIGLEYARRLYLRLDEDGLARRARQAAVIYVVLVALELGFRWFMPDWPPAGHEPDARIYALLAAEILVPILIGIGQFLVLAVIVWRLRRALLA